MSIHRIRMRIMVQITSRRKPEIEKNQSYESLLSCQLLSAETVCAKYVFQFQRTIGGVPDHVTQASRTSLLIFVDTSFHEITFRLS